MPHITFQFPAAKGPLLDLLIGVSLPRQQALQTNNQPVPNAISARALIDTGASCTCVDPEIIRNLQLQPTGSSLMHTPSTGAAPVSRNQYDVQLTLVHPNLNRLFYALPVIESDFKQQGFQALLGRDVLAHCLFVYDGQTSIYTLAF